MLVIALPMSLEGVHAAFITSGMPYGESQPFNGGSSPSAYYYSGRTYVTWQGSDLDPFVAYYDSATGNWTGPVRVGDNPLILDDHGPPAILVDNSGYIHVMYGSHTTAIKHAKSANPEDISTWTAMPDPVDGVLGGTYPQLFKDSSGKIYLIYRGSHVPGHNNGLAELIIKSTDGGVTWGTPQTIIDVYTTVAADIVYLLGGGAEYESATNRVHLAWVLYNATAAKRENLYYAYLNLNDDSMYSIDGTNLSTTITQTEADADCKVVDSGTAWTNMARVRVDGKGNPYIIYITSSGGWRYNFTRWTGSAWSAPVMITTTDDSTQGNEFFIDSSTNITAYLVGSGNAGRGGDIEQWSWNGSTWNQTSTILKQTDVAYGLDFPMEVVNGVDLRIVFCEVNVGASEYIVSNLRIFAYDGRQLIPYEESQLIVKRRS